VFGGGQVRPTHLGLLLCLLETVCLLVQLNLSNGLIKTKKFKLILEEVEILNIQLFDKVLNLKILWNDT